MLQHARQQRAVQEGAALDQRLDLQGQVRGRGQQPGRGLAAVWRYQLLQSDCLALGHIFALTTNSDHLEGMQLTSLHIN